MTTAVAAPARPSLAAYHERRRRKVDDLLLSTARRVLVREGLAAATIERISAESGVAKTTIYRRFENATELAIAAVAGDCPVLLEAAAALRETTAARWSTAARAGDVSAAIPLPVVVGLVGALAAGGVSHG